LSSVVMNVLFNASTLTIAARGSRYLANNSKRTPGN